jgi:benzoyl-CoA reductase/2-hydroxyglutaryl-CoA dehydratase subunit BcrC/BadD/HgdB
MNDNMNKEARERLDDLLKTDPNALTGADIEFLQARSEYLTDEQKAALDKLPKQQEEANKTDGEVNTSASAAEVTGAEVEADNANTSDTTDYASMKKADLQDELRSRKIEFDEGALKEDLVSLLEKSDK